jgi:hypothetical protein
MTRIRPFLALGLITSLAAPARARDLADFIPRLYGGDQKITVRQTGGTPHDPSYLAPQLGDLIAINEALAELPATLPVGSSAASFTYELDESGVPRRVATEGLGPLFAERARTIGQLKFDAAFVWSHIDFTTFEGEKIDKIGFTAPLTDIPGGDFLVENNVMNVDIDIRAREDIFSFFFTFGVTDWLDVNAVVPLVYIDLSVRAHAEIGARGGATPDRIHTFDGAPDPQNDGGSGDAFGLGDILLRAKWKPVDTFFGPVSPISQKMEFAVLGQVKLPTGDDDDLLGTGHTNWRILGIASKTFDGWFEPHVNFGYEWSGSASRHDAYIYAGGFGVKVIDELTMFADVVGRHERKTDELGDDIVDLSIGAKVNPWRNLIGSVNFLVPLNEQGLRADFIPSVGVEYIW